MDSAQALGWLAPGPSVARKAASRGSGHSGLSDRHANLQQDPEPDSSWAATTRGPWEACATQACANPSPGECPVADQPHPVCVQAHPGQTATRSDSRYLSPAAL